jgi:hypothetical protein
VPLSPTVRVNCNPELTENELLETKTRPAPPPPPHPPKPAPPPPPTKTIRIEETLIGTVHEQLLVFVEKV